MIPSTLLDKLHVERYSMDDSDWRQLEAMDYRMASSMPTNAFWKSNQVVVVTLGLGNDSMRLLHLA